MATQEIRLRVGEEITPDADRVERLAAAIGRLPELWHTPETDGLLDLVRILHRAAALLHEEDRPPRG